MSIQSQDGLDGDVDAAETVLFKHDLCHPFPVLDRVHRRLGQQDLSAVRVDLELFLERIVPQEFHVVPVLDDAVLHRLRELEVRTVFGREVADHDVLDRGRSGVLTALFGSEDRSTDDGREGVRGEICRASHRSGRSQRDQQPRG